MARTDTTEGQALWQPGEAEEDRRFREDDRHLHLAYDDDEEEKQKSTALFVCWLLNVPATSYSVSQGRICSDNFTCCHTEIEVADQTFYLTQSQYTDTGPTSPSADPISPGPWQGSHWSANF